MIIFNSLLNFRMWFKNGLKAQKPLAQGSALGYCGTNPSPCKGKSFKTPGKSFKESEFYKAFALTGRLADCYYTQGVALG